MKKRNFVGYQVLLLFGELFKTGDNFDFDFDLVFVLGDAVDFLVLRQENLRLELGSARLVFVTVFVVIFSNSNSRSLRISFALVMAIFRGIRASILRTDNGNNTSVVKIRHAFAMAFNSLDV